jgi:hypothetical protein
MSELKRLRDQDSDRVGRLLLDAGHFDEPPKARLDRIVAAIAGAGAAVGAKTALAGSALAAAPLAAKSLTPLALVLKWLGVGLLAGLVVSGGAASFETDGAATESDRSTSMPQIARRDPEGTRESRRALEPLLQQRVEPSASGPSAAELDVARQAPSRQPATRTAPGTPDRAETPVSSRVATAEPSAAPVAESTGTETSAKAGEAAVEPEPSHALREELAALSFAKSALNRGAARVALDAVQSYRARFPRGALAREATYIEMEAEHALGNRGRAFELARELAPGVTPNAERAREILKGE